MVLKNTIWYTNSSLWKLTSPYNLYFDISNFECNENMFIFSRQTTAVFSPFSRCPPEVYTYTESGEKVQLKRWDPRSTMRKVSNTLAMAPKVQLMAG